MIVVLCPGKPDADGKGLCEKNGRRQIHVFVQAVQANTRVFSPKSRIVQIHTIHETMSIASAMEFAMLMINDVLVYVEHLKNNAPNTDIWALANQLVSYEDGVHVLFAEPEFAHALVKLLEQALGRTTEENVQKQSYGGGYFVHEARTVPLSQP